MPLRSEQLKILEEKLLEGKKDIEGQLPGLDVFDFGSDTDHFEEEADETEEFSNRLGTKLTLERRLEKIEKALTKIKTPARPADGKEYGRCEKCRSEISFSLLEADPESELCQQCKISGR
jgi:RNA polymerase-binding transcription factor DksA